MTTTLEAEARQTSTDPVLRVDDLHITFRIENRLVEAVKGISFDVHPGEVLALVGESGSGKSVTARAILNLLPPTATTSGRVLLSGQNTLEMPHNELRQIRGRAASMIFQEPAAALDPVLRIGEQLVETLRVHETISRRAAHVRSIELLRMVGIPEPENRVRAYPHQLSGGQLQRVMIAMAIAMQPPLLIADEPTTALDVTVQASILGLLRTLRDTMGTSILLISHNMGVVADLADRMVVMYRGDLVEEGPVEQVFAAPARDYTRKLLASVPRIYDGSARNVSTTVVKEDAPALELRDVSVTYRGGIGRPPVHAVRGVSLSVNQGEIVGLVGESGSGKSTLTRSILGLLKPSSGTVHTLGSDPYGASKSELVRIRRDIGMVFQDPRGSLNPRMTLEDGIAEPMVIQRLGTKQERRERVRELLESVELPADSASRYPHQLSGGQRQRACIARALILKPKILVADEPTSALDVSVQAAILKLLKQLQAEYNFACLFITHDLAVVGTLAHKVAVMQHGLLVEYGDAHQVLAEPREEYTKRLIATVPIPDPAAQALRRESLAALIG
jgi:peptide/nickel transport system ATP-binding protein